MSNPSDIDKTKCPHCGKPLNEGYGLAGGGGPGAYKFCAEHGVVYKLTDKEDSQ